MGGICDEEGIGAEGSGKVKGNGGRGGRWSNGTFDEEAIGCVGAERCIGFLACPFALMASALGLLLGRWRGRVSSSSSESSSDRLSQRAGRSSKVILGGGAMGVGEMRGR